MTEHTRRENGQPPHLAPAPAPSLYPSPSQAALKLEYVGKDINDIQAPAAIIDAAVVRRNCEQMLDTAQKLEVRFRAHVKTHKVDSCSLRSALAYADDFKRLPRLPSCKSDRRLGRSISSALPFLKSNIYVLGSGNARLRARRWTYVWCSVMNLLTR